MASLLVRNLPDDLVRRLRIRAAENSRSAEAEHRAILEAALAPRPKRRLVDLLRDSPLAELDPDRLRARDPGREIDA
jgi:plasmid stability protein